MKVYLRVADLRLQKRTGDTFPIGVVAEAYTGHAIIVTTHHLGFTAVYLCQRCEGFAGGESSPTSF